MDRLFATYHIETAHPLEKAAAVMAGEQSAGTFVKVPGETLELLENHGARVERITELESVDTPTLAGSKDHALPWGHHQCRCVVRSAVRRTDGDARLGHRVA